jgi:hypothetical protein
MEKATRKQERKIKELGLGKLVPLNIAPEKVDDRVLTLLLEGKINCGTYAKYHCSNARQCHTYVSTFLSDIRNNLYMLFAN